MITDINRDVSSGYVALDALLLATGAAIFGLVLGIQAASVLPVLTQANAVATLVRVFVALSDRRCAGFLRAHAGLMR